jgi:hypothetical protein
MKRPQPKSQLHTQAAPRPPQPEPDAEARVEIDEPRVEQLEDRIAPKLASNHNQTFLVDG